jgi:hypothetical protein
MAQSSYDGFEKQKPYIEAALSNHSLVTNRAMVCFVCSENESSE